MNKEIISKRLIFFLLASLALYGCKAAPAQRAGFVDYALMKKNYELPFHHAWIKEGVDFKEFTELYIPEVNTSYLLQSDWWKDYNRYAEIKEDVEEIAEFTQKTFAREFRYDPKKRFKVVSHPGFRTAVLEIAIVEIVPNKPALKAAGFVPVYGMIATAISQTSPSTVAIEARIRDGATGEIIGSFADREQAKSGLPSTKDFTWYSHAQSIIEEWAQQLVAVANRRPGEIINDSPGYSLKVW